MSDIRKIGLVAKRDFVATVTTKGFVLGLLIFPALIALGALVGPRFISTAQSPQVAGEVAIIDSTGVVGVELRETLSPSAIEARRAANARREIAQAAPGTENTGASLQAIRQAVGQVPMLTLRELPADSDLQREKAWLTTPAEEGQRHLALIVVHDDAVTRAAPAGEFGSYDLYAARALDDATETSLRESLREALVNARLKAGNFDPATITTIMRVNRPASTIVSAGGEQRMQRTFTRMLPFALGLFLFIGIIMGGQGLMTSTVEEKSSRVVEVVLASVSPFELMAGKLLSQLGIGMITIGIYVGLGFLALFQFAMFGLVDPDARRVSPRVLRAQLSRVRRGDDGDWRRGQRDGRSPIALRAGDDGADGAVHAVAPHRPRAQFDAGHGRELRPADQHASHDVAAVIGCAAADVAGRADDRDRTGRGVCSRLVCRQDIPHCTVDAREAAELCDARQVGTGRLDVVASGSYLQRDPSNTT